MPFDSSDILWGRIDQPDAHQVVNIEIHDFPTHFARYGVGNGTVRRSPCAPPELEIAER